MTIFDPTTFTGVHSLLSVVALLAGSFVVIGLLMARDRPPWTALFLATAVATSVTGFGFPFHGVLPSHLVATVALLVLAAVIAARYAFHRAGAWRRIDAAGIVASLYFLVFVAIAQAFLKVPALKILAPTQSEPPFAVAQLAALVLFVGIGWAASRMSATPRI
jgi:hypothetical protein